MHVPMICAAGFAAGDENPRTAKKAYILFHMEQEQKTPASQTLGAFTCNICGEHNVSSADASEREQVTCAKCRSTIRFRSILLTLSRALFGLDLKLSEFPILKSVRGLGFSDSDVYSGRLENCFSYTNTFYHREPRFDLSRPDEKEFGRYDFVICSDVLEHVPEPVERAFLSLSSLLKPTGILILTVPYSLEPETIEHYPDLAESGFAEIDGQTVLVGRLRNGEYRVLDQLQFHGGTGSTLERRLFSDRSVRLGLAAAGFSTVRLDATGSREFGVAFSSPCSLPISAGRDSFALSASGVTELVREIAAARKESAILGLIRSSRWLRLGRALGFGPALPPPSLQR